MAQKEGRPAWFKMLRNQRALIDAVPDAAAGKALKAIFAYFDCGNITVWQLSEKRLRI